LVTKLSQRAGKIRVIGVSNFSPPQIEAFRKVARGLLSGRMTGQTQFAGDDLRKNDPKFQAPRFAQYLRAVERLDRFAQANYGRRAIHLALRWILDRQDSTVALWGARRGWVDAAAMDDPTQGWLGHPFDHPKGYADVLIRIRRNHYKRKAAALARPL
jgi:aryl-alcohol dehydrogenase-like predicted oxidoreductase